MLDGRWRHLYVGWSMTASVCWMVDGGICMLDGRWWRVWQVVWCVGFVCWIVDGGECGRWCGVSGLYVGLSMVENVADVGWLMVESVAGGVVCRVCMLDDRWWRMWQTLDGR